MSEVSYLSSNGQPSTRSRQANSGDRTTAQLRDIRQKQLSHVLYWRFFVNLALMLIDAAMYIIAGATVLNLRHEATPLYSSRFNFTIDSTVYLIIVACFWVWSLYVAGIYHRHVMGDGYQLNVLLAKGMVVCWVVQCAFNYFFNLGLTLTSLCLVVIAGWLLTMVERIASRAFITRSRRKGAYAYGTVIIGSPHGIGRTLQFLGQRRQLNYRPVAVCPIHLNPDTGLIEQSADHETLREEMQKNKGCQLPVLEYSDHNLAEQIIDMNAQTVMVADELRRYSDNYDIFSVRMESFGLEIAMLASAADTSNHEIQVRSIQGTTIITQRLAQYTPARRLTKRLFDLVISSLAIICSSIITIPVAIAIKVTDGGPVFYKQTRMGLRGKPFQFVWFAAAKSGTAQRPQMRRRRQPGMGIPSPGPGAFLPGPGRREIPAPKGQLAFQKIQQRRPRLARFRQFPPSLLQQRPAEMDGFTFQTEVENRDQGAEPVRQIGARRAVVDRLQQGGQGQIVLAGQPQAVTFPQQRPRPLAAQSQRFGQLHRLPLQARGPRVMADPPRLASLFPQPGESRAISRHGQPAIRDARPTAPASQRETGGRRRASGDAGH